jgi:large subunit ribosomal protein L24
MQRFHVKKGDEVVVLAGTERGKRGKIIEVLSGKQRVIVEGAKMIKRHTKKQRNPNAPQGGIIEREGTIHISNVMLAATFDARAAKRGVAAPTETPAQA